MAEKRNASVPNGNSKKARSEKMDDVRVRSIRPLISPEILIEEIPPTQEISDLVAETRKEISKILHGEDDRVICIVGPCSIHDPKAALDYASLLKTAKEKYAKELLIVMRVYFEKPRTTVGWKGLINDPFLDETFQVNKGLKIARQLLTDINALGLPAGVEFLDTISPQFIGDLVSWGAIGARTTESQCHRELASGVSCPVGFKNGTGGSVQIAADAMKSAAHPHHFLGVTKQGLAGIVETEGNQNAHLIMRGGSRPNYSSEDLKAAAATCTKSQVNTRLIVDCSHGNSSKVHTNQPLVAEDLAKQMSAGEKNIVGIMVESNLIEGNQKIGKDGAAGLKFGQSVTDACVSWDQTAPIFEVMSKAVIARRQIKK